MVQRFAVLALAFSLLTLPGMPFTGRAAAAPAGAAAVDGGWPRAYTTGSGARLVLYEPQVVSWDDQKGIVMYAAAAYTGKDRQTPAFGTLRIEADTRISLEERLVSFSEFSITASNFPTLSREQVAAVVGEVNSSVPRDDRVIGLDRVLASVDVSQVRPRNVDAVKADPPAVFYSTTPAVLVNLDGDPIWSPTADGLRFAVNTNWDLFEHMPSSSYVLRIGTTWMKASRIGGPWAAAGKLPDSFSRLPADDSWKDARAALPPRAPGGPTPIVFVSTKPAELILLRGKPVYAVVPGTGLLWVSNTDSDIFRAGKTGPVYYLVSGRWFTAPDFKGPWTFATPNLPEDFKKIPIEHPRSRVLASVPGTTQALEAVLLAQVPQTSRASRTQVMAPDVVYQGEPQFQPIEKTAIARAVNTDKDILKAGNRYYMCFDGVWFVSKSESGPWTLTDSIPGEIYEIPISSPAYRVTGVRVASADDEAVVFATEAAHAGMVVAWGCAVWGTGWYYPPYVGWGGSSPVYYPRYSSYGYGARYNPWTGSYTREGVVNGSTGAGYGARYNPKTGTYLRGAAAWGGEGGRGAAQVGNPRTRGTAGIGGGGSNVFAGYDGNAYRNQNNSWQRYENGRWTAVNVLSPGTLDQLNHDFAARRDGSRRTSELGFISSRNGGASRAGAGTGSYRPSGSGVSRNSSRG
jgi:hypothetical protein